MGLGAGLQQGEIPEQKKKHAGGLIGNVKTMFSSVGGKKHE